MSHTHLFKKERLKHLLQYFKKIIWNLILTRLGRLMRYYGSLTGLNKDETKKRLVKNSLKNIEDHGI